MALPTSNRPFPPGRRGAGSAPASTPLIALLFAVSLLAAAFLTDGCASSKKAQEAQAAAKAAEQENANRERALEEADAKIADLEQQVEELSIAKEEGETAAEERLAEVKQTYETLTQDLQREMESGKIQIEQSEREVKLNIAEELFFETGKAAIKPEGKKVLLRIGKDLQKASGMNIRVEGHTDNVPIGPSLRKRYPTNWELSAARAVNVARFLQDKAGIAPRRLSAVAYAQYRPVASNKTAAGRQRNRRVEIVLVSSELDTAKKEKAPAKQ